MLTSPGFFFKEANFLELLELIDSSLFFPSSTKVLINCNKKIHLERFRMEHYDKCILKRTVMLRAGIFPTKK